ncbi:TPR-like protein [Aureobasidium pullulans]|uniref:TPR-like protein n=1 Tax=Aureobasidium pullulans TaxID=5580 RepID=A0AB74JM75_AURPU|nr:TPR-like protein [Aureobasidium pullulans]THX56290.1 TPR-like protein [Aureobasidium pullulans]
MTLKLEDYKVGWITALPIEAAAARAMLDEIHPSLQTPYHDSNVYTFGQANTTDKAGAGTHNVVVASGRPGKANAATVANDMRRTFPWLRIGLMVGIAGGVWSPETDVRLGDVVVGIHPTGEAGIIQYDYGKSIQDKAFVKTGTMNKAPGILLNAVAAVQAKHLFYDLPDTGYISNLGREYAKRFARRPIEDRLFHASFWGIFWINVSSQVIAEQSFADLAQAVGLSNTTVQHVVHWLSNLQRSWLLVLDNYDDKETDISKFIPSSGGSIIITTRLAGLQGNTEVLDAMDYGDAIELLYKACIIEDKEQNTHMYHAKSVVELLGRHALALVHAGAYIRQGYTSLEEYSQLFQQQQKRLMQFEPGHLIPGNDSVYATFEISAQYLASSKEPADQKALGLLNVLAFMEGSNIHEDMLVKALESGQGPDASGTPHRVFEGAPWTTRSVDYPRFSKDDIDLATLELRQIPWAWDNNDPNMIKILRQVDSQEVRALYKDASRPLRTPVFPKIHKRHLKIETLESFHLPWDFDFETGQFIVILREMEKHEIDLLFEHTARHRERGRFEDSISQSADGINEGHSSHDLAGEAKILLELVLKERSKSFTAASKEVLVPIVTLAQIYLGDGDHQMVIPMLEPITWPKSNNYDAYDGDHRDSIYTLALAYMKADQYTLAKVLLEEVVTSEKHLSLTTEAARLSRMDTLAQVYVVLGEEYRAEPLFDEINALRAQMWDSDPESPYQLMGMRNLVTTYLFFGLFENAAYILADIVRVTTRTLHLSHPTRLENMAQLAAVSLKTGSNDNAIELLEEVLRLGDSKNPPRHRVVADLAEAYIRIGKSDKALNLLEKTLENDTSATTMTEDHKIGLWRKLATAYGTSGQCLRAVSSLQEILQVDENNGDPARVGFLEADLATAFMNLGDIDKAVDLLEDAISRIVQKHTPAAYLLSSKLALAYMWTDSFAKAIPVLEQLIQAMQVGKKPVDSELMLEECKLSWAYFQTRDVFKATYLLDEGMQTQALVYPFKYEVRLRLIIEQATDRLVLETPTGTFEATIMLEAAVELEERYMKVDFTSLSDTQFKLLDVYRQASDFDKLTWHLENVLNERLKSLSGAAKGPFLENWFDAWQDYLKNDDEGILLLETATAEDLKGSDGDDLDAVQHAMAGIYLRSSNDKKAVPLLEAIFERESATLTLEDIHRLECMASLGKAYLNLKEFTKAIDMFRALNDAFDVLPFQDERRLTTLYCSALAYLNVDQPTRAAQLLEEVVIIEARLLPEDHAWRLLSMRRLAQAYMELEKIRKLEDAVSLLQKVMQRGRETLHTDPQELAITEAMLADARDTLAKTLQLQSRDQILASASALMRWACREITSRAAIMF